MTLPVEYALNFEDFELVREEEEKIYSKFVILRHKPTGRLCTGRYILESSGNQHERLAFIVNLSARLRHPYLQLFRGYVEDKFVTIADAGVNGDLQTLLDLEAKGQAPPEWDPTKKTIVFWGLVAAVKYLHSKNIVMRNVKPKKILLDKNFEPHLSDLSICQLLPGPQERIPEDGAPNRDWASPEQINDRTVGLSDDIYSLALVMRCLLQGDMPKRGEMVQPLAPDAPELFSACYSAMTEGAWSDRCPAAGLLEGMKEGPLLFPGTDRAEFEKWRKKAEPYL